MKKINERCISHNECESNLCFQGICTDKKSARIAKTFINQRATTQKEIQKEIQSEIKTKKKRIATLKTELGNAKKNLTQKNKELKSLKPKKNNTPKEKLDELETEIKSMNKTIKQLNHIKSQQTQMLEALIRKNKKKNAKEKKKEANQTRKQRKKRINEKFKKEMKQLQKLNIKPIIPREGDKCAICFSPIQPKEYIIDCINGHTFHNSCVEPICSQRKKKDRNCPVCKEELNCVGYPSPMSAQTPPGTPLPWSVVEVPGEMIFIHSYGHILDASIMPQGDYLDILDGGAQIDGFEEFILNETATEKILGEFILHLIDNVHEIPHDQVQELVDFARHPLANRIVVECNSPGHHWIYDKDTLTYLYDYHENPFTNRPPKTPVYLIAKLMGQMHNQGMTQEIQNFFMSKINIEGPFQPNNWYYDMDYAPLGFLKYYPEINAFINNSGKFYDMDFNQMYGSNKREDPLDQCFVADGMPEDLLNDLRDKLPEKHFKQFVQTIYITNPILTGTFIIDRNSREIIYSSSSTTHPLGVNWGIVHRYMLSRYGNGIF